MKSIVGNFANRDTLDKDVLGKGGFTTIFKSDYIGEPCAIKYIDNAENSKRYIRKEVEIYKRLSGCNHVVRMLDYRLHSNGYVKYELLDKDLLQVIPSLTEFSIISIASQLKKALEEIHSRGVVHCDIKPENIMFDFDGTLKLIDFGNAMFIEELNITKQVINTLHYRPPEYIIGAPMDERIDTWAMGCTIMEMLTNSILFNPRRDNNVYAHAYLLGEMITVFGDFRKDFIMSGKYSHKYFDLQNDMIYLYKYLLDKPISLYKLLQNYGYTKDKAKYWTDLLEPYFIR